MSGEDFALYLLVFIVLAVIVHVIVDWLFPRKK
jgi:hypothetical protein